MAYKSDSFMFRSLDDTEEEAFRKHARENDPPAGDSWALFHPVCRDEWRKRGLIEPGNKSTTEAL